jgi:hypothetical protein
MTLRTAAVVTAPADTRNVRVIQWTQVGDSDTCEPVSLADFADRSVQVEGTFGSATIALHGSNDGTNYRALKDSAGDDIAITAGDIVQINDLSLWVKPVTSGGTDSHLNITLVARS